MDLIVYDQDCLDNKPNWDRPNLEMLKTKIMKIAFEADRVFLLSENRGEKEIVVLKDRLINKKNTDISFFNCRYQKIEL